MNWTLANIRSKMRKLTGRIDSNIVTDSALDTEINAYYQYQFPDEIDVHEYFGFTTFETVAGTETYSVPDAVAALELPLTIADSDSNVYPLDLYTDAALFKTDYPDDMHDESDERDQPTAMLLFGRSMYLRPVPDAVYTVKYARKSTQPTAMSADGDTPADEKWGPLLAYGPAIEYLQAHGQNDEADELKDLYNYYRNSIARRQLRQLPTGMRALPRF